MNFSKVDVTETGSETATVTGPSLDLIPVRNEGRNHARGQKGTLAVRSQYLAPTEPCADMLHGKVALAERLGGETVLRALSDAIGRANVTLRPGAASPSMSLPLAASAMSDAMAVRVIRARRAHGENLVRSICTARKRGLG
jgi:hypothetical protein